MSYSYLELPEAPAIPGLRFRCFAGEADYPAMVDVTIRANEGEADYCNIDMFRTSDAIVSWVDRARDRLIVEMDGQMIGCGRVETGRNVEGERIYLHNLGLVPEWRGRGIGTAVLLHNERRLCEIAADHPHDGPRLFATWSILDRFEHTHRLLRRHGYRAVRKSFEMIRPYMDPIPDCPLPSGVELRPVEPAQLRAIWNAMQEAFRDHWNCIPRDDHAFEAWANDPVWRKDLTAIAWDGDQCVGMVLGLVSEDENRKLGKKRIWTESISVRRPWRKRGVARALIAQCLRLGRDAGFVEAGLGVDAENLSGALGLYEKMGYRTTKQATAYRKPLS